MAGPFYLFTRGERQRDKLARDNFAFGVIVIEQGEMHTCFNMYKRQVEAPLLFHYLTPSIYYTPPKKCLWHLMPVIPALKPWGFEFSLGAVNPGHHCNKNKYIVVCLHIITTSQSLRVTHTSPL